ncbi:MAG: ATP-dependent Clp protease adapter ClpS [Verrucomicrobia bacterium]|nr:ATP-dependent Clp protease adapter ClpS [Verrucomicrobiota bacterium]
MNQVERRIDIRDRWPGQFLAAANPETEVLDAPIADTETVTEQDTPWNVIVFNDPVNLMPYVTMVLQKVFGYSEAKATQMMLDVHQKGKCVVWSGEREKAEFYVQQLQGYQLQATMKKA